MSGTSRASQRPAAVANPHALPYIDDEAAFTELIQGVGYLTNDNVLSRRTPGRRESLCLPSLTHTLETRHHCPLRGFVRRHRR